MTNANVCIRNFCLIIILAVFVVMAGACGDGDPDSLSSPDSAIPSSDSAAPSPDAPDGSVTSSETLDSSEGGTTFVRLSGNPLTLDPHEVQTTTSARFAMEIFGGLVTLDLNLDVVPDLAERWTISDDGTVYTFFLRPDAVFHNGKPVTAQDVKWSIERAADPQTPGPHVDVYLGDIVGLRERLVGAADAVSGVRVIDDRTLEITIDASKPYFLAKLTYPVAFVLDQENIESNPDWLQAPNGTGPFRLASHVPGEELVLAANEAYHLGPPRLAFVRYILDVDSASTALRMYQDGEIHILGVGGDDLESLLDPSNPLNAELVQAPPDFFVWYIGMNATAPPFDDPRVRQAMAMAIDKEATIPDGVRGRILPAKGILPQGFPGFSEEVRGYDFDPERARQVLAESRYGPGLEGFGAPITWDVLETPPGAVALNPSNITLGVLTRDPLPASSLTLGILEAPDNPTFTNAILQMWRDNLGIEVVPRRNGDFGQYIQAVDERRLAMFELGWVADYPDPENFLDLLFHSESSLNHMAYSNQVVDGLLEQARVEHRDQERRFAFYQLAEQRILDDAPWIPLYHFGPGYVLIKPNVQDFRLTPLTIAKMRFVHFIQ